MEVCLGRFFCFLRFQMLFHLLKSFCHIMIDVAFLEAVFFLYLALFELFTASWKFPGYSGTFFSSPCFDWEESADVPLIVAWSPKLIHCCCVISHPYLGLLHRPKFILHQTRVQFGSLSSTPSPAARDVYSHTTSKQTVKEGFTSSWDQRWKNFAVLQSPNDPNARPHSEGERGKCGRSLTLLKIRPNHWKHVIGLIFPSHQRNTRHPVSYHS